MISVSGSSYQNQNTLNKCLFNSEKNKWKATLIYILTTYMSTLSLQCWNCDFNCANASVYLDNTAHLISGLAVDLLGSGTATVFSMNWLSYKYLCRILDSDKSLYQAYKAYVQYLCKFKSILYMFQIYNLCFTKQLGLGFAWLALSVCYTWEHLAICQRQNLIVNLRPDTADGCPCLSLSC